MDMYKGAGKKCVPGVQVSPVVSYDIDNVIYTSMFYMSVVKRFENTSFPFLEDKEIGIVFHSTIASAAVLCIVHSSGEYAKQKKAIMSRATSWLSNFICGASGVHPDMA